MDLLLMDSLLIMQDILTMEANQDITLHKLGMVSKATILKQEFLQAHLMLATTSISITTINTIITSMVHTTISILSK